MYGSEIWPMKVEHELKLTRTEMSMIRWIVAGLDLLLPQDHTTVLRTSHSWRTFNFSAFIRDLCESSLLGQPPTDIDQLFDCYHQTLQTLVNVHAPLKTVRVRANRTARWYDAECRCTKRDSENGEEVSEVRHD